MESLTKSEWISVNDRLPEPNQNVFTLYAPKSPVMEGIIPGIHRRLTHEMASQRSSLDSNNFAALGGEVFYWMPIPKRPKTHDHGK